MHLFPSSNFWPKNESNDFFPKYVFSPLLILFFFSFSLFGLFMQFKTNPNQKYSENSSFTGKYSNIHIPLTFCCVLTGVLIKSLSQAINLFVHLVYISKVIEVFVLGTLYQHSARHLTCYQNNLPIALWGTVLNLKENQRLSIKALNYEDE